MFRDAIFLKSLEKSFYLQIGSGISFDDPFSFAEQSACEAPGPM
jgi:hypothetical protein